MIIPEGATHYSAKNKHFYNIENNAMDLVYVNYWRVCVIMHDVMGLWPLSDDLTWLALRFDEWPTFWSEPDRPLDYICRSVTGPYFSYSDWKYRRTELGLDVEHNQSEQSVDNFPYKMSADTQHNVLTALLTAQATIGRVLDGEECYNAAVVAYDQLEQALEDMEV